MKRCSRKCKPQLQGDTSHIQWDGCHRRKDETENECWQGCGEIGTLAHCWWNVNGAAMCKTEQSFLKNLKVELPYYPAIPLLGMYPKEAEGRSQGDIRTLMFEQQYLQQQKHGSSQSVCGWMNG